MPIKRAFAAWPWAVAAWMAGIALQLQQPDLLSAWAYAAVLVPGLGLLVWGRIAPVRVLGLGAIAWALTGWHAIALHQPMPSALEGQNLDVVGRVQSMVQRQDVGLRFRFVVEQAQLQGQPVLEFSTDEKLLHARLAKKPSRSPEWETRSCKNSAEVRPSSPNSGSVNHDGVDS